MSDALHDDDHTSTTPPSQRDAGGDDSAIDIERAAIELLAERGVLAGLNLREVADRAGVGRTLLYYHFDSRQDLLRSAIARIHHSVIDRFRFDDEPRTVGDRAHRNFDMVVDNELSVRLTTLLELDGGIAKLLPNLENRLRVLAEDQREGRIAPDIDVKHVLAAMVSIATGYTLFRERLSNEMWVPLDELDVGVGALIERIFDSLGSDNDQRAQESDR